MTSDLDRKFDETLAAILGPGGRIVLDRDDQGRPIVANFPATLPSLLRTFCALNAATEALIAGDERFTFAELDDVSERLARALVGRGIAKGERVAIAMRNCPAWIVTHMAVLKAGAVATLLNGWWQAHEMEHALKLSSPALVIADGARGVQQVRGGEVVEVEPVVDLLARDHEHVPGAQGGDGHDREADLVLPDEAGRHLPLDHPREDARHGPSSSARPARDRSPRVPQAGSRSTAVRAPP